MEEREKIARGLAQKKTLTAIAGGLGRSVSTVSREVARNSGATATALPGPIGCRRCGPAGHDPTSRRHVEQKLRLRWSKLTLHL